MDDMNHHDLQASDPHAGHNMSDMHGSHDRHAGHSVAMFRDKFWLSLALTIPVRLLVNGRSTLARLHSAFLPRLGVCPGRLRHSRLRVWRPGSWSSATGSKCGPFPRLVARCMHSPPCSRTPLNGFGAQTRNLCHSPSCALATSCLSGPEPAFRQTARSLKALPRLTSR
jgi:hypothetical protein